MSLRLEGEDLTVGNDDVVPKHKRSNWDSAF